MAEGQGSVLEVVNPLKEACEGLAPADVDSARCPTSARSFGQTQMLGSDCCDVGAPNGLENGERAEGETEASGEALSTRWSSGWSRCEDGPAVASKVGSTRRGVAEFQSVEDGGARTGGGIGRDSSAGPGEYVGRIGLETRWPSVPLRFLLPGGRAT